jgi:hypothetical protein
VHPGAHRRARVLADGLADLELRDVGLRASASARSAIRRLTSM